MMNDKLEQLQKYLEKMEQFNHVNTLLYWDMRTNTPKEGFYCCPNNSLWSEFLSGIFIPDKYNDFQNLLIDFAKKVGKDQKSLKSLTISGSLL